MYFQGSWYSSATQSRAQVNTQSSVPAQFLNLLTQQHLGQMMDLVALDLDLNSVFCSWYGGDGGTGLYFLLQNVGHTLWV